MRARRALARLICHAGYACLLGLGHVLGSPEQEFGPDVMVLGPQDLF